MKFLAWTAGIITALYVGFLLLFPSYTHRYRITVEVEADGKVHSGSAIWEGTFQEHKILKGLFAGGSNISMRGVPVVVNLGQRGAIVALVRPSRLRNEYYRPTPVAAHQLALNAYYGPRKGRKRRFGGKIKGYKTVSGETEPKLLNPDNYPAFVWLRDPNNVRSAEPAPPFEWSEQIDPSVALRSITLQITSDGVSGDAQQKLPWLKSFYKTGPRIKGNVTTELYMMPEHFYVSPYQLRGY